MTDQDIKPIFGIIEGFDPDFLQPEGEGKELEISSEVPDFIHAILDLFPGKKVIVGTGNYDRVFVILAKYRIDKTIGNETMILLKFFGRTIPASKKQLNQENMVQLLLMSMLEFQYQQVLVIE